MSGCGDRPSSVWLEGEGFLTADGRYFPEDAVRAALLAIAGWWGELSDEERAALLQLGHLAALDREVDRAVFGEQR